MNSTAFSSRDRARRHPIALAKPAVNFFDGALLGNGGLGVVVCTRPDAVQLFLGHNNVWDIRIAELTSEQIGTFQEVFEKVKQIPSTQPTVYDDPWFSAHNKKMTENYDKPYPRPLPCGSVVFGFDPRSTELLGHSIDIGNGHCDVSLLHEGRSITVRIFVELETDRIWLHSVDASGQSCAPPFERVAILRDQGVPAEFPALTSAATQNALSMRQVCPSLEPHLYDREKGTLLDRAYRLQVAVNAPLEVRERRNWDSNLVSMGPLERGFVSSDFWVARIDFSEGPVATISEDLPAAWETIPTPAACAAAHENADEAWRAYWEKSGVAFEDDPELERIWYHNLYFLNCSAKPGVNCPGLFANWSHHNIGSTWHGDYHFNYNTQQPFWVAFSSNHVEKHLPYVDLVHFLLPVSRRHARNYYGLRGAYFPHSAYPVEMTQHPYPSPIWGWQICETPWTVQSLWWHYRYTADKTFLRERALVPLREACEFLVDFIMRPAARGPQWGDDRYHIYPTVSPEIHSGLRPGLDLNFDCLVDLTLIRFVFNAYLQTCDDLSIAASESALTAQVRDVLAHLPAIPTADSARGRIFVSVPGEDPETVFNTPNSLMTVFPGEEHGLHSPPETLAILENTLRNHRNEGGNELVFLNLQRARLGRLDLEKFKRQVNYCLMPNGATADLALQSQGRYTDQTSFDFMARMGVWFENFALPVVINECLLQSYNGELRFFPNWPAGKPAEFHHLRAVGAFLVSARHADGLVLWIEIFSEAGTELVLHNPWPTARIGGQEWTDRVIRIATTPGQTLRFQPSRP